MRRINNNNNNNKPIQMVMNLSKFSASTNIDTEKQYTKQIDGIY